MGAENRNSQSFQHKLKIQKHVTLFLKLRCRIPQKYKQIWFVTITKMSSFRLFKVQLPSLLAPLPLPVAPFREVLQSACQLWHHHGDKRSIFYRLDSNSGQDALWCISIRSKLFCYHREIIKKRSYNIKFHADLVHNRKRHVFHRPVSLEKSELFHHFSSQFWSRNNYDKKKKQTYHCLNH